MRRCIIITIFSPPLLSSTRYHASPTRSIAIYGKMLNAWKQRQRVGDVCDFRKHEYLPAQYYFLQDIPTDIPLAGLY